jgi:hypothetical protein
MQSVVSIVLALGAAGALCAHPAVAQTLVRSVNGPAAGAQFGKACVVAPDQNGDGFKDVVVGAPGFNSGRGAIYCVSGLYLASGSGTQLLWSLAPTANVGDGFGAALADVGDITGDGAHDFLVGQPGYTLASPVGAVRLVDGVSHTILSLISGGTNDRLGSSIAACGDINSNGFVDVILGSPMASGEKGTVRVVDGIKLTQSTGVTATGFVLEQFSGSNLGDHLGASVAGGVDLTGDGVAEVVVGVPGSDGGAAEAGRVIVFDTVLNQLDAVTSFVAGELFGSAVSIGHDYDGDGVADIVVGAPNSSNGTAYEVGRFVVLSGARVVAQTPPYEIFAVPFGAPAAPPTHSDPDPNFHFGAAVHACADLNGDGVGEILVGAPGFFTQSLFPAGWNFRGAVRIYSGASHQQLTGMSGGTTDRLGDGLGGAVADFDGDGFAEFVVAGSLSDAGGTDSGVLKCYRLFPLAPSTYCTGKVNSLGCTPFISSSGTPSASSPAPFTINGSSFVNQKSGLLFYSHVPTAVLFQGGTKCVKDPTVRTPPQSSGGSASGSDCSGSYAFDFNAWFASGIDPALAAGAEIYAQYWSRDPASASHTSLSNAVAFVIHP